MKPFLRTAALAILLTALTAFNAHAYFGSGIGSPLDHSMAAVSAQAGEPRYLYREYQAREGRWSSRDPIGEEKERNIYCFVNNYSVSSFDRLGLFSDPPAPNCAPCEWGGWVHNMPEGSTGRDIGLMDGKENPAPGMINPRKCCACGKSGTRWQALPNPKCEVKIYFAASVDPDVMAVKYTPRDHELRHMNYFIESFRARDALYKTLAPLCIPDACEDSRRSLLIKWEYFYRYTEHWKDARLHCEDYPADLRGQACAQATSLFNARQELATEVMTLLSRLASCLSKECSGMIDLFSLPRLQE